MVYAQWYKVLSIGIHSMKITIPILCVAVALLAGCSKKEAPAASIPPPSQPETAAPPVAATLPHQPVSQAVANAIPEISKAVQSGQYDSAVQQLQQLKPMTAQMSDAQRLQYQQALRDTTAALVNAGNNPAAKAAYEKLSRMATGR